MATVNKDFRVKHGLIVEGATGTINSENILTEASTTDVLGEGTTNLYYTNDRVKDVLTGSSQTNISITEVEGVLVITAESGLEGATTNDLTEGTTNLYFTNQRALDATSTAYDVAGAAAAAQTAAEDYADGLAVNYDVAGAAAAAQTAAEDYADGLIGDATVDGTSGNTVTARIATAVSDLVASAPETLDTLNELAAALGDDANFATSVSTAIGLKQNTLTPGSNIDITTDIISVTGLDAADISDFDSAAVTALEAVVPNFTAVEVNAVAKQVAASVTVASIDTPQAVLTFAKAEYRSAKLLVKTAFGSHTEVSEILLTLDSSDNIAITEYAEVATNGSLADITADISGSNVRIMADVNNNSSTVSVYGTLLA